MSEHPEYAINTVTDMLAVPPEKWRHMLEDLHSWLVLRADKEAVAAIWEEALEAPPGSVKFTDTFHWIDDGAHDPVFLFHDTDGNKASIRIPLERPDEE